MQRLYADNVVYFAKVGVGVRHYPFLQICCCQMVSSEPV